eukprot:910834-Alexandrium_andersonii.AAC.1
MADASCCFMADASRGLLHALCGHSDFIMMAAQLPGQSQHTHTQMAAAVHAQQSSSFLQPAAVGVTTPNTQLL